MNITLTSLEALILKATNESLPCPDPAALEAFCAIMKDSAEGPQLGAQALAARIHSPSAKEAMLALTMLDRCMRRGDTNFQAEVGKFRFLNEMIKLVSPKYFADRTAPDVKTRVLQLFHAWAIEYPKESKFKVAYEMLKNQGVIKETPAPLPSEEAPVKPRVKHAIFEDEEKSKLLQKLLQSKKPEDVQHANRLIKTMVREEERRSEASCRRAHDVAAAGDAAGLLLSMLASAADASADEEQLIHELFTSCMRQRTVLQRLASDHVGEADELDDILHVSDMMDECAYKYQAFVMMRKRQAAKKDAGKAEDTLLELSTGPGAAPQGDGKSTMDELGDIFSSEPAATPIVEPLKPVSLMPQDDIDLLGESKDKAEGWDQLDSLGEQLLKQSLPDNARRVDGFVSKSTKKIPMNALEKISPKHEAQPTNSAILDLDFFTQKPVDKPQPETKPPATAVGSNDDIMVDISTDDTHNGNPNSPVDKILDITSPSNANAGSNNKRTEQNAQANGNVEIKPLTNIHVTLEMVSSDGHDPVTLFSEPGGVTVVLYVCVEKPRPDVNVVVLTTTSQLTSPLEDYNFQVVVPKNCKARLLPPSGTSLPARNPFRPPPAITQLLLIARPQRPPRPQVELKFVITYTSEGDTYSEIGSFNPLPLPNF
ncbi:ADP-ribosylation factor-binding protein GGA3 isoform X2 [Plutella xylostella]|uniref:ADP-ribosylation factor-binding protein GGA3 isoform X2 n=1 Tax=Plutella xylostella TaxID=51655 RepID=UPI002032F822|nr:ADP-ribosylation factor-binding protein GGA3 isoform X2 [Plutella xylostella]